LFSPRTLAQTAQRAGFALTELRTTCVRAFGILLASVELERRGGHTVGSHPRSVDGLRALWLLSQEWRKMRRRPDSGDEILLTARNT
jgi:hypothetical protein